MTNEPHVEIKQPEEAVELLECFGHRKIFNLINGVAQEFYLKYAGSTFFGLEDHSEFCQTVEQYLEIR